MENTKTPIQATQVQVEPQKLLQALYHIWDAFERANLRFFLVHQTALDAMKNHELEGDKVEIGIRRLDWLSGSKRILDAFIQPLKEDDDTAYYEFEGVPIVLHIYEDSDCVLNTDVLLYKYEQFRIPNPYSQFVERYG